MNSCCHQKGTTCGVFGKMKDCSTCDIYQDADMEAQRAFNYECGKDDYGYEV
jgi:hypothetical protein